MALSLTTAIGTYRHTRPLKDGTVTSDKLHLDHRDLVPANRAFRPMINRQAFDVSEMALVTLILGKACQRPIVGIPTILMQQSAYGMLLVRADSPLRAAKELEGRSIGVRAYTQTTGTWLRGMLSDQFGVDLSTLQWITFEAAHVDGFQDPENARRAPDGKTLAGMLRDGEIDAAAGLEPSEHPDLRPLLENATDVEEDWIRQTGVRPINHTLVVRRDVLEEHPWVADELAQLVTQAKRRVGGDVPPDGLALIRGPLTVLSRYALEQRITSRMLTPEELYSAE
jgi:4,5-dihydroxyphthalate decarboxylase